MVTKLQQPQRISMPRWSTSERQAMNDRAAQWEREEAERKAEEAFRLSRVPEAFRGAKPDDLAPILRRWAENPTGRGLILAGGVGRGKTHAACAILAAQRRGVRFVTAQEVTAMSYPSAEGSWEFMGRCRGVGMLAIDDLGKAKPTEWMVAGMFELINARYQSNRPTIITTNYTFDKLEAYLTGGNATTAEALVSRLRDFKRVVFTGEDRRGDA